MCVATCVRPHCAWCVRVAHKSRTPGRYVCKCESDAVCASLARVRQDLTDVHARLGAEEREQRAREVELSSAQIALQSERNKAQDVASELESTKARMHAIRVQIGESQSVAVHEERALHTAESELKQVRLQRDELAASAARVRQDIDEQRICLSEEAALFARQRSALAELRHERNAPSTGRRPASDPSIRSAEEASAQRHGATNRGEVDDPADTIMLGAEIERLSAEKAEEERRCLEQRDVLRRLSMLVGALRNGAADTRAHLSAIRQVIPIAAAYPSPAAADPDDAASPHLAATLKPLIDALLSSLELRAHASAHSAAGAGAEPAAALARNPAMGSSPPRRPPAHAAMPAAAHEAQVRNAPVN